jgi:hypothetical protein
VEFNSAKKKNVGEEIDEPTYRNKNRDKNKETIVYDD